MASEGSRTAVFAALAADAGITVAKFAGAALTGSSSMLAEALHSVADTANQGLLLLGQKRAEKAPDRLHPFGYGRNRYFYGFVVALVLFSLGSLAAILEGIGKIRNPEHLSDAGIAIAILAVAMVLETFSLITGVRESRPLKRRASWWRFIRESRNPELPVVLLEDSGALIGLVLAFAGVGLTVLTGDPIWDGIGTLGIGVLLGMIATVLIVEMKSLLIGEGATRAQDLAIRAALVDGERLERVIHLETLYLGPEELLVAAKLAVAPGTDIAELATAIDAAEVRVRTVVPIATRIYLEPDLYHARPDPS